MAIGGGLVEIVLSHPKEDLPGGDLLWFNRLGFDDPIPVNYGSIFSIPFMYGVRALGMQIEPSGF